MLASSAATLPEGQQWSYEVKWDGYRTLALKDGIARQAPFAQLERRDATVPDGSASSGAPRCRVRDPRW